MSTVVQLFIMRGGALEGTEMVSGDRFIIGSDPSSAVQLEDPSIAPRALGVFVHDGKLAVQDLGSFGGVSVNGEVITAPRYINAREDVVVGVYTLKLKLMGRPGVSGPNARAPGPGASSSVPVAVSQPPQPVSAPPPAPVNAMPPVPIATGPQTIVAGARHETSFPNTLPVDSGPTAVHRPISADSERTQPLAAPAPQPRHHGGIDDEATLVEPLAALRSTDANDLAFHPALFGFDDHDEDDHHDDVEVPWSLVEQLVRVPDADGDKHPIVEVVHYRGERVVDHRVLQPGQSFALGDRWSKDIRLERGLDAPVPVVRLKADGKAELVGSKQLAGRISRQGLTAELQPSGPTPLVDGEIASLRVGQERLFVRFAAEPVLLWTPEQRLEARAERRLLGASAAIAVLCFVAVGLLSWLYGYRSKSEDIIELGDDGFAEVVMKDLEFEEPPKEPEKPPPPIKTAEAAPQKPSPTPPTNTPPPKTAEPAAAEAPKAETPKPGLAAALQNIPRVNDTAANQNLTAALSNIKGVRVPGAEGGFKTSALTGKGPSSGVQIGGAAGGVATSGINSLIRKDGAAGSLGDKGERAVAGKVVGQPRLSQVKGTGELSKDEIQRVITSHVGEIQYCYEKQLRQNTGLAGRVVLEWVVTPTGSVSVVKVTTSSLSSTEATNCMMDKVKKWKFPKPRGNGGVTVVYPFVFNTI
ncbi:MAG TPA: AgmX/PglI C-terminal domain-containing protein [Myxococcota bacterium]